MTDDVTFRSHFRVRPFRIFVTNKYYENRDEYHSWGLEQPYSLEEYIRKNLKLLKQLYREEQ
jgi:hypothetical protein